jgi:hypothetical protein
VLELTQSWSQDFLSNFGVTHAHMHPLALDFEPMTRCGGHGIAHR